MTADFRQYIDSSVQRKTCTKCREEKPLADFTPQVGGKFGVTARCKFCRAAKKDGYYPRRPAKDESLRWRHLRLKYGVTPEAYDQMLEAQGGLCAICRTPSAGGRFGVFVVDHCHTTGAVRGLLCAGCNSALGRFGDTSEGVQRAVDYLRAFEQSSNWKSIGELARRLVEAARK